jgi:hypothetical protein
MHWMQWPRRTYARIPGWAAHPVTNIYVRIAGMRGTIGMPRRTFNSLLIHVIH